MIELRNICKTFILGDEEVRAVNNVDLIVEKGEYLTIMGPSGSGKSTLLNLIALLDRPTSGEYRFDGRDVTALSDDELAETRRDGIGFIFQSFHLIARLTASQNVELPLTLAGIKPSIRNDAVANALHGTGLTDRARHRPQELSGGERQRVAVARAVAGDPSIVLADEPTGNLDRENADQVLEMISNLAAQHDTGFLVVTHDESMLNDFSRTLRLENGSLVHD